MYKRFLVLAALLLPCFLLTSAENTVSGIIVTCSGSETCYKLSEVPTVSYREVKGIKNAQISITGNPNPVASIPLENGATLTITYGTYTSTGIGTIPSDKIIQKDINGKKIFTGGHIIIIDKEGKKYDINGTKIN